MASFDAASWVWSTSKGEMARINGVTAKVDTRVDVPQAGGHQMQVSQTDQYVILRDVTTGRICSMDLTSLQVAAGPQTASGIGVSVALHDDAAFVIDTVQGVVQQIDPRSLTPIGPAAALSAGHHRRRVRRQGPAVDRDRPARARSSAITAAPLPSGAPDGSGGAGAGAPVGPKLVSTTTVAPPSHDLTISTLDGGGVAVLNRTTDALTMIDGDQHHHHVAAAGRSGLPRPRTPTDCRCRSRWPTPATCTW